MCRDRWRLKILNARRFDAPHPADLLPSGSDAALHENALAQCPGVDHPGLRQIEHATRNRELAALVACEDAQLNTDIRVRPDHRIDCLRVEAIRLARAEMFEHLASIVFHCRAVPYCWKSFAAR